MGDRENHAMLFSCVPLIVGVVSLIMVGMADCSVVSTGDYNRDFQIMWSPSHVNTSADGRTRTLTLDQQSGSGFASDEMFLFGAMTMEIKLVPNNSAGTVVAFYLTSHQPNHDEIDLEFLGNVPGQAYTLQTNVYVDGMGSREERVSLWFDPTLRFHNYTILWSKYNVVFLVDWIPIRVFPNRESSGALFPRRQAMALEATLWDGSDWATRGGLDKIVWAEGPFVAAFGRYTLDACVWTGSPGPCESAGDWWNRGAVGTGLTERQMKLFRWVRRYHLVYDYCRDPERFGGAVHLPKECHPLPQ